jgi:class 3 adenylate cyclase
LVTTQTVTLLFTDLVRSTELSSSIGPEAANSVRREHFGLLRAAIDAAGGHEVKNLGDGLMVAFTSLSRALACAVAIQQGIERHNRRGTSVSLSIRIGLSTGEATEDQGDFFGEPVIEAARLCASAAGGQILATDTVKVLAGRHATQEFVSVGDLPL